MCKIQILLGVTMTLKMRRRMLFDDNVFVENIKHKKSGKYIKRKIEYNNKI